MIFNVMILKLKILVFFVNCFCIVYFGVRYFLRILLDVIFVISYFINVFLFLKLIGFGRKYC